MSTDDVLAVAAALVDAFGRHDVEAYFGAFRADATFVFHSHPEPLGSRAEYEALWRSWEQDVRSCAPGCTNCYAEELSLRMGWSRVPWTAPKMLIELAPPVTGERIALSRLKPERAARSWTIP